MLNQGSGMLPAAWKSPSTQLSPVLSSHDVGIGPRRKQLQLHNYLFQPCHLPISFCFAFFFWPAMI